MSGSRYLGTCDRRRAVRVEVDLSALWRPCSSDDEPSLALVFDLSTRGARIAGWTAYEFAVGDRVELWIEPAHVACATVARVLAGGEYGVQFDNMTDALRTLLINTVGAARAGRNAQWAQPPSTLHMARVR